MKKIFLTIFLLIATFVVSFISKEFALFFLYLASLFFGLIIIKKDSSIGKYHEKGFITVYLFYSACYIILVALGNITEKHMLLYSDSALIYDECEDLSHFSLIDFLQTIYYETRYRDASLGFIIRTLVFYTGNLFQCNLFYHLNVIFNFFILSFVFCILLEIVDSISYLDKSNFKTLLVLFCFSPITFEAFEMTRDIYILLTYTAAFYAIYKIKNVFMSSVFIAILCVITYFLRVESGYYLVIFPLINVIKSKKYTAIELSLLFIIYAAVVLIFFLPIMTNTLRSYSFLAQDEYLGKSSLATSLFSALPEPFRTISKSLFSQLQPFPFFLYYDGTPWGIAISFLSFLISSIWFGVFISVSIDFILNFNDSFAERKNHTYIYLFIISILLVIIVSHTQFTHRRMCCVYPVFIIYYITNIFNKKKMVDIIPYTVLLVLFLNIAYMFIK